MTRFEIDCNRPTGPLGRFWACTGLADARLLLDEDVRRGLTHIASLPDHGIEFVRVKHPLDLIEADDLNAARPWYDFRRLDDALDVLISGALRPVFVLMGNPSRRFSDFRAEGQLRAWKHLIRSLGEHLVRRYGAEEVERWYFESWSGPDLGTWPRWPDDPRSFLNYYDATASGLLEAHDRLRIGGPATGRTLSPLFKAFLELCDQSVNHLTGSRVPLDFISIHERGGMRRDVCAEELRVFDYIRDRHPRFVSLPLMNTEAGSADRPTDGERSCHAGPCYAASVARGVHRHLLDLMDGQACRYGLLNHDHGIVGPWSAGSLLTRYDGEGEGGGMDLIRKPVLNLLWMMGMLGESRLRVRGGEDASSRIGAIASRTGDRRVAVLVYHGADEAQSPGVEPVQLCLRNVPFSAAVVSHFRLDASHGNPFQAWRIDGAPDVPSPDLLHRMRQEHAPARLDLPSARRIAEGALTMNFDLPRPGVSLIVLDARGDDGPLAVTGLRAKRCRGIHGQPLILLAWTPLSSLGLRTYEITRREGDDGPAEFVSPDGLLCAMLLDESVPDAPVTYRVRAIDHWDRAGEATEITV